MKDLQNNFKQQNEESIIEKKILEDRQSVSFDTMNRRASIIFCGCATGPILS